MGDDDVKKPEPEISVRRRGPVIEARSDLPSLVVEPIEVDDEDSEDDHEEGGHWEDEYDESDDYVRPPRFTGTAPPNSDDLTPEPGPAQRWVPDPLPLPLVKLGRRMVVQPKPNMSKAQLRAYHAEMHKLDDDEHVWSEEDGAYVRVDKRPTEKSAAAHEAEESLKTRRLPMHERCTVASIRRHLEIHQSDLAGAVDGLGATASVRSVLSHWATHPHRAVLEDEFRRFLNPELARLVEDEFQRGGEGGTIVSVRLEPQVRESDLRETPKSSLRKQNPKKSGPVGSK